MTYVGIVGSRYVTKLPESLLDLIKNSTDVTVVSGGARGIDTAAKNACIKYNKPFIEFKPEGITGNHSYGMKCYMRNKQIVNKSDVVFALPCSRSKGTHLTIKLAEDAGKTVHMMAQ